MANNDNRYRHWMLNRKNKSNGMVKSSKPSQYIVNERKINRFDRPTNLNSRKTLKEINFEVQQASQSKRPTYLNSRKTINEINFNAQRQRDLLGKRPISINDQAALNEINYNAKRADQLDEPTNLNNRRTLKQINYNAQRAADKLGRRPLNIKDKKALNNELDYKELQETLTNRSQKIIGAKFTPEIPDPPAITGDFLVRENELFIATENDKLIELDIS